MTTADEYLIALLKQWRDSGQSVALLNQIIGYWIKRAATKSPL